MVLVTWDSINKGTGVTLSSGNLTAKIPSYSNTVRANIGRTTGKWFFEIKVDSGAEAMIGIVNSLAPLSSSNYTNTNVRYYYQFNGNKYPTAVAYGTSYAVGNIIGVLLDLDNGKIEYYKNGVSQGVAFTDLTSLGEIFPAITTGGSTASSTVTANFGTSEFNYIPSNLPIGTLSYDGTKYLKAFNKFLILSNDNIYKYHDGSQWLSLGSSATEQDFIDNGMDDLSIVPQSAWRELNGLVQVVHYTDNPSQDSSVIQAETEPFSVYDYISETPEVLVYTELNEDITVETTTEPFDIYDEFGEEVEVLYYTDDTNVNEADLMLEANWSPIDELKGDFEVVTWTDEPQDSAQRVLEMVAIPKPQFIKLANPKKLYGYLDEVVAKDISKSYRDEARYLFSNKDGNVWYVWDFELKEFVVVDSSTHSEILKNGMKWNELKLLSTVDWRTWKQEYMNIGVFLKDNPRDTITSIVDSISYKDYLPRNSVEVEKANFYILNTTARIDLDIVGNTVEGVLSDDDLTRVQYRILLNGLPYYPVSGSFTELSTPPQNINLTINSNDIAIDDWNTVKVEFRDFFGTIDFWQTSFIGTYSGLMFKDVHGDYYSNEIGEVLKYLDFGTIIAGQTTIEHEIILKNQYGYDVKNVHIYGNSSNFPNGMSLQFSKSLSPFTSDKDLLYTNVLGNNDELSFYVRISTVLGATPNANGSFDIVVRADKA